MKFVVYAAAFFSSSLPGTSEFAVCEYLQMHNCFFDTSTSQFFSFDASVRLTLHSFSTSNCSGLNPTHVLEVRGFKGLQVVFLCSVIMLILDAIYSNL